MLTRHFSRGPAGAWHPWALAAALGALIAGCYNKPNTKPPPDIDLSRDAAGGRGGGMADARPGGSGGTGGGSEGTGGAGGGPGCQEGAPCALPDAPCLRGETRCMGETATCVKTTMPQANGTACGPDQVCHDGMCTACQRGLECPVMGKQCRVGAIECTSGKAECVETGNAPNGADCGQGMVCRDGACAPCAAGGSCVPANPCHEGTQACTGGTASCTDMMTPKPTGTSCGVNKVCNAAGACVACVTGMECELPGDACQLGKIDCTTGAPACVAAGNAANGKECGAGKVCSEGRCADCSAGMPCTPANRCHTGTLSCTSGSPQCTDTNTNARNGSACGTNLYCSNGQCVSCTPDVSCDPGNPCKAGRTTCETGTSQCRESGNAPNGRGCGNGRVCSNGNCVACTPNMQCQPSACKVGVTSCSTGASVCQETGNAGNGSECGAGRVCSNGSCVACNQGGTCPTGNPCKRGTIACGSGSPQCQESGNASDGTGCGGSRVCVGGTCRDCNPSSAPTCRNGQRVSCSSNGTEMVDNCGGNGCTGNRCNTCRPGDKRCGTSGVQTCRSDGSGFENTMPCPGGCDTASATCRACGAENQPCCSGQCPGGTNLVCAGGSTCRRRVCTPNSTTCEGEQVRRCNGDGTVLGNAENCPGGYRCTGTSCGNTCRTGTKTCRNSCTGGGSCCPEGLDACRNNGATCEPRRKNTGCLYDLCRWATSGSVQEQMGQCANTRGIWTSADSTFARDNPGTVTGEGSCISQAINLTGDMQPPGCE